MQLTRAAHRNQHEPRAVDNTDWLKTAAIICGFGWPFWIFFSRRRPMVECFWTLGGSDIFFFMGYAKTRTVPLPWIWLGFILTLLESWNAGWTWVAPNILFSFALIRIARPYVRFLVQHPAGPPSLSSSPRFSPCCR